jgi:beta-galactosidase
MVTNKIKAAVIFLLFLAASTLNAHAHAQAQAQAQNSHRFALGKTDFLLDGKPFQIISGEMHPARIPREYWRHRIRMAKAMGCNTIAVYIFWNYHETAPGSFDFTTGNKDIAAFIRLCKEEGLWVLLRPGPYVCAEWDWGGLPSYLLKIPDIKVRCRDPRYMSAVTRYVARLSKEVVSLQCDHGGPILMVQVENEYGSYANDREYLAGLHRLWKQQGITVPFYTADGPTNFMLEAGNLDGCAIGLDSGGNDDDFAAATRRNPNVPAFSSETYPGWLTHWKEKWQHPDTAGILKDVRYLLSHHRSFNLYVIHGGTNFGYTAGANAFTPVQFQPDVTSYDYDAPINEQGRATPKYEALRQLIAHYTDHSLPEPPAPIPVMEIAPIQMEKATSLWDHLPAARHSAQPLPMEYFDQSGGMILYRTKLIGHKSGSLTLTEPHDYALVFLNGKFIDTVFRDGGNWTVKLPKTDVKDPVLDILVEGMGHINFAQYLIDRKGITDRVTLNGMTLMNWEIYNLPLAAPPVSPVTQPPATPAATELAAIPAAAQPPSAPAATQSPAIHAAARPPAATPTYEKALFFKGAFTLDKTADTYFDLSSYKKGVIWVNGHNLGRYWYVGPQQHLYCPASWLKKGANEIVVLDLLQDIPAPIKGVTTLE